jgi:mRNA interferase RelE/StbE
LRSCDIFAIFVAMKTIIFSRIAEKQYDSLPLSVRGQVDAALDRYAARGEGDVRKLADRDGYRLRAGRYRIIFAEDAQTVLAIYIGKRETHTYD